MYDNCLFRIVQCSKYLCGIVMLHQCTRRTGNHTLPACHASGIFQLLLKGGTDICIKPTLVCTNYSNRLCRTTRYTTAAKNTLVVVTNQPSVCILFVMRAFSVKAVFTVNTVFNAKTLQLTIACLFTAQARTVMCGKNQLQRILSCMTDFFCICPYLHPLTDRIYASRHHTRRAKGGTTHLSCLYHANAAGSDLIDFLQVAQGGHIHTGGSCCLQNGRPLGHTDGNSVNCYIYHIHLPILSSLVAQPLTTAPKRQVLIHTPHLMHFCVSIVWGCFTAPEIASAGHLRAQAVQPRHFSGSIE